MTRPPNFFLVGAPRSGTTAMWTYLSAHPDVFMSTPKEPVFWDTDYPNTSQNHSIRIETLDDYLRLFEGARPHQTVIGEASTTYLSSKHAVKNILRFNPDARFMVMLRNPVEIVHSWHQQKLVVFDETEADIERAWALQELRATGSNIPTTCREPKYLQYRQIAALGSQVERLMSLAPQGRVKAVIYDDLNASPRDVYCEVLEFLGVPDDDRSEFPITYPSRVHRVRWLAQLATRPPQPLTRIVQVARRTLRRVPWLKATKDRFIAKSEERRPLRPSFRRRLVDEFAPEVNKLSELLNRDLSQWR